MRQLALRAAVNRHWREKRQCLSPAPFSAHWNLAQIRPKPARNPSLRQGCYPSPKESTHRLTRRNRGHFGWGAIITLDTNCTFTNIPGPGVRTANFADFGSRSRVLPKNAKSLRDSDAHDARCCSAGVAAPLGCVICLQLGDVAVFSLCAQYFLNVRGGGGITTPGVLCVLPKRRTSACQSGSFAAF